MSCRNLFKSVRFPMKGLGGFSFVLLFLFLRPFVQLFWFRVSEGIGFCFLFLDDAAGKVAGVVRVESTLLLGFERSGRIVISLLVKGSKSSKR